MEGQEVVSHRGRTQTWSGSGSAHPSSGGAQPPGRAYPRDGQRGQLNEDTGTGQDWMQLLLADAGEWWGQVWAASPGTTQGVTGRQQSLPGGLLANRAPQCHPPWTPALRG